MAIAATDDDETIVKQILNHRTINLKRKNSHDFLVQFIDGSDCWLAYKDIKNNEALDKYLETLDSKSEVRKLFS